MPRKPFEMRADLPYHLSARTNGRDWFDLELKQVWQIMQDYLFLMHHGFAVRTHSFVLMANHFHWIASFPLGNLSSACEYFMRETSRSIGSATGRINHVYGSRIFRSCLSSNHYFQHAYKYIYRNPVDALAVERVEDYPFSTLHGLLGRAHLTIPVDEDTLLFEGDSLERQMAWLNAKPDDQHMDAVRKALRRPEFALPKSPTTRSKHFLETGLL